MLQSAAVRKDAFHVAILDANLPDTDGYSLAERMRGRSENPRALIMMLKTDRQREHGRRRSPQHASRATARDVSGLSVTFCSSRYSEATSSDLRSKGYESTLA
jgi:DNA-binding response OmpR family regulator